MARSKKRKFEEVRSFANVFEYNDPQVKERLRELSEKHEDVVLELGCGKGEYTVALARRYPNMLFLGVDIQGERIWRGARDAIEGKVENAYFLRVQVENIKEYLPKRSVNEIWITFPDPFLRERQEKKRLTSPRFLEIYKEILQEKGVVHLKTDSQELFDYTVNTVREFGFTLIKRVEDIYLVGLNLSGDINEVQTTFEKKHLAEGRSIKYLQFSI